MEMTQQRDSIIYVNTYTHTYIYRYVYLANILNYIKLNKSKKKEAKKEKKNTCTSHTGLKFQFEKSYRKKSFFVFVLFWCFFLIGLKV
jgi:hypothetical protein